MEILQKRLKIGVIRSKKWKIWEGYIMVSISCVKAFDQLTSEMCFLINFDLLKLLCVARPGRVGLSLWMENFKVSYFIV